MSVLNNSVIIYEPSPKYSLQKGSSKKNKNTKKIKKTYYESPLKHIAQSNKIWQSKQAQQRLMRTLSRSSNKKKMTIFDVDNTSLQDSVIILSDNESETCIDENTGNTSNSTQNTHEDNRLSITHKRHKVQAKSKSCVTSKRKRKHADDSCIYISDTEDSEPQIIPINVNEPVRVPQEQGRDDIKMVYASKENTALSTKCIPQTHGNQMQNSNKDLNERIFTVDNSPSLSNLNYLRSDTGPRRKRPRGWHVSMEDNRLIFSRPGLTLPTTESHKAKGTLAEKHKSATSRGMNFKYKESESRTNADPETSNLQNNNVHPGKLREIIIDGCNIAMSHTKGKSFSEIGLKLVIDYFKTRGHTVKAFVSHKFRSIHRPMLEELHTQEIVVFTPSRCIAGRRITPYDDRYILEYATMCGGIVVSFDQYRDLYMEKPEWRNTIEKRLLAPTFVGNYVMFPEDPLGRNGPRLDEFLRH
ncbi:hypothetical protein KM043_015111 [Ampulex compressa]|nr:hypothetical protein KM043_015111 [Ampulex compressa]